MNSDKLETRDKKKTGGTIKLSARLLTVAGFVGRAAVLPILGTDHGYIPVYLARSRALLPALAMIVRPDPPGEGSGPCKGL